MVAVIVVQTLRDSRSRARRRRSSTPKDPEIDKAFDLIDSDHDGKLTRIEVVKAIRSQKSIQTLLGLSYVWQEDGTREKFPSRCSRRATRTTRGRSSATSSSASSTR